MRIFSGLLEDRVSRYPLRLQTLTRLRWLAVAGQSVAVMTIAYGYGFPFPIFSCFAMIACSALLNFYLTFKYPSTHRLEPVAAMTVLVFDVVQLAALLYMTGGLTNPFSVLICVPVIISSAAQPARYTVLLVAIAALAVTFLAFFSLPLPWFPGEDLTQPLLLVAGTWIAILSMMTFSAIYAYRVSSEATQLADALAATELTLQREHHLSALDGLAAAAAHELGTPLATISVVAKEMQRTLGQDERLSEDLALLTSQSERCRDILRRISTLSSEDEAHMRRLPLSSLIEEVIAPHREFGIEITTALNGDISNEPIGQRNPGILHGLGNLIENAVDFASSEVRVESRFDREVVEVAIHDDGPGFSSEVLSRIGEPFMTRRSRSEDAAAGGLGLGVFIAKTLLERSGATLWFGNTQSSGAKIVVSWPRARMELAKTGPTETGSQQN